MTALPAAPSPTASLPATALTVRDAAARLDVTPRTLKYYEELGIVVPVRSEGGYRLYEQADLDRLARVLRMRSLGFSLPVITAMLQQPVEAPTEGGRPRLSNASLKALRETLTEQLGTLDTRVAQVRRELKEAALLQAQLRRDLDYVERRLAGEPVEEALEQRRKERPAP
ncbi:MerR family transcriptional regulator [Variovorax sp. J22G73]|jgi:DNA-binding transcriptional MerR regulator|uniref:MerR family transcriptional regulator n=1 Tax=unclassified Variovorax TaxID=663243 RepID=UPI000D5D2584|nr:MULTISPECIES: MerR family transcriptional regulator [unclassified Variovorax]MDM0010360.1 MerR family transcriptional regulator [Variovorax sp. J22R203]MDM0102756.1 MerR family transcriptional regulator [Variovorax sp. J22G73]